MKYTVNHFGEINRYTHRNGKMQVNFVGRLENMRNDVARLSQQVHIPLDIQNERMHAKIVSQDTYAHYSEAYDDEMVDCVYRLYQKDLVSRKFSGRIG